MSDSFIGLTELVNLNDKNVTDYGISDLFDDAPVLRSLAADVASNGTTHKWIKETGAPTVGFRAPNAGIDNSKSADTIVSIDLEILDASFSVDKAVADAYVKGPEAMIAREAKRFLKAALFHAESQCIYGTGSDSGGFVGLANESNLNGLSDAYVVSAGGSSALTSVYVIRTNNGGTDVQAIVGNGGVIKIDDTVVTTVTDSYSKRFTAYHTPIIGWMGLQVGSVASVVRVANIDDSSHKATDALIAKALELFPAGRGPTFVAMNRRSLRQLQQSRTATNATGAPAPFPTESFGVPIVVTDAIVNTETALV